MDAKIQLLDCTLRDGAYITESNFGTPAMKGIIKSMQDANVDIIECGWLKNTPHKQGTSFFHTTSDLEQYLIEKRTDILYTVMIDWDRYDLANLPVYNGKSVDAIRIVFPHGRHKESIEIGRKVREKGYRILFQAANTLAYSEADLKELAQAMNEISPDCLSVVDTFGAMYEEDLRRIVAILNAELKPEIKIGFHSHNNQQLSFALSIAFVEMLIKEKRAVVTDSSLCGMGRGAGNTTTELLASYLNKKHHANYDMNIILDAIDMYMGNFKERFTWGYSTPYFISGLYCTHVNNIAYLLDNHRTTAKDLYNIISSMTASERIQYDYDLLENKYLDYHNKIVDDKETLNDLKRSIGTRPVLLIASGKSILCEKEKIYAYIKKYKPIVIGINAVFSYYEYDYLFFCNKIRYTYAKEVYATLFTPVKKIITSNVITEADHNEMIVNFNTFIKRGWQHFDNSVILCLRLLSKLHIENVALAGFDGFKHEYAESYADATLPTLNPDNKWDELNIEIKDMFEDLKKTAARAMHITFLTESIYNKMEDTVDA